MKQKTSVIYIASAFAILFWGMSYLWTDKLIGQGISIFYFVFIRMLLAGIVMFMFNAATSKVVGIHRRDIPKFLLLAFCEPLVYFICETYGLKETGSPTLSAMIIATIPIFSIGAGIIFFKEKINKINIIGIIMSLTGIVMVAMAKGAVGDSGLERSWSRFFDKKSGRNLFQPDHSDVSVSDRFSISSAILLMERFR